MKEKTLERFHHYLTERRILNLRRFEEIFSTISGYANNSALPL